MKQIEIYAKFQKENPEKFNEDFIYNRNEDIETIMEDISIALETAPGIKFVSCTVEEDESKFRNLHEIEDSRLIMVELKFQITGLNDKNEMETDNITLPILLPKLIDDFYYQLNGNRYFAIYQMVDKGTYTTNKTLSLKSLLMPIIIRDNDTSYDDINGNPVSGKVLYLEEFKHRINYLLYYICKMGWSGMLEFLGKSGLYEIYGVNSPEAVILLKNTEYSAYKINSSWVLFTKDLDSDKSFLVSLIELLITVKPNKEFNKESELFWLLRLGKYYSRNINQSIVLKKGKNILLSLERILDGRTKKNLVHVSDNDKESIYHIVRWMTVFFNQLCREDNMDLKNKRIRLNEYVINPLLRKFSDETYRILNSKQVTLRLLQSAFSNIQQNICIKKLVTGKLLRYVNCVNGFDLFSSALKISQTGPQGLSSDGEVAIKYRGQHPSYIGNIGLNFSSASDPGMSATLTPFVETKGLVFDDSIEYETNLVSDIPYTLNGDIFDESGNIAI